MCIGSPPRAWGQPIRLRRHTIRRTVHPHGRGDNWRPEIKFTHNARFTPTGVGTTYVATTGDDAYTVHPHGRGDNAPPLPVPWCGCRFTPTGVGTTLTGARAHRSATGSPPRAWGQQTCLTIAPFLSLVKVHYSQMWLSDNLITLSGTLSVAHLMFGLLFDLGSESVAVLRSRRFLARCHPPSACRIVVRCWCSILG